MRKFNAILTMLIFVLFLLHAVLGSFQMLGVGNTALKTISWVNVGLIVVHALIGVKFTVDTLKVQKKTGVAYFKENQLFWIRRLSGFAIMALLVLHLTAFGHTEDGIYRLYWFHAGKLATQILLVISIAIHVISNVRPLMIALGVKSFKRWISDILIVFFVLILFMAAAFLVYYLRWNIF